MRYGRVFEDVTTPGTPEEFEREIRRPPQPPTDFSVTKTVTENVFHIGDRNVPKGRLITTSYRVYFTPIVQNVTTDLSNPTIRYGIYRAGTLVATVDAQGKAATLLETTTRYASASDKGYFTCVGVNTFNQESLPMNVCPSPWN